MEVLVARVRPVSSRYHLRSFAVPRCSVCTKRDSADLVFPTGCRHRASIMEKLLVLLLSSQCSASTIQFRPATLAQAHSKFQISKQKDQEVEKFKCGRFSKQCRVICQVLVNFQASISRPIQVKVFWLSLCNKYITR